MSGLAAKGDLVALDTERPEHDTEGQIEGLEHRSLLDVKLEVCGCAGELASRIEDCRPKLIVAASCGIEPSRIVEYGPLLNRAPSSSAQLTRRTVTGGVPSSAIRRNTSTPATTLRAPSSQPPFGTESMWPPTSTARSEAPLRVNH